MDIFHVDIILVIILCFLILFMCAYGVYCVYRLVVSLQMQILLRPTRVMFSHKQAGQSREELRTVVAYQNPFTGDYCVHKSRDGARGYLNATPSPDSGLSDEYEPLQQPALRPALHPALHPAAAHSSVAVDPGNQLGFESLYRQNVEPAYSSSAELAYKQSVEPAYKQSVEPAYKQSIELAYRQSIEPLYNQRSESSYKLNVDSPYKQILEPVYQRRDHSMEPAYHQYLQSGMTNGDPNSTCRQMNPALTTADAGMGPPHHRRGKPDTMLSMNGGQASVKLTSTQNLDNAKSRVGWMTHLKSALRKPRRLHLHLHRPRPATSAAEDHVLTSARNWNYKEYQI